MNISLNYLVPNTLKHPKAAILAIPRYYWVIMLHFGKKHHKFVVFPKYLPRH